MASPVSKTNVLEKTLTTKPARKPRVNRVRFLTSSHHGIDRLGPRSEMRELSASHAIHTCETPAGELLDQLRVQPVLRLGHGPARGGGAGARGGQGVEAYGVALVLAVGEEEACRQAEGERCGGAAEGAAAEGCRCHFSFFI